MRALVLLLALCIAFLGVAPTAAAPPGAPVAATQADVAAQVKGATAYLLGQLNLRDADAKAQNAVLSADNDEKDRRIAALEQAVAQLAQAQDIQAKAALAALSQGQGEQGLAALRARAAANSASALADWKQFGALAFAIDTDQAVDAYEHALALAPDDPEILFQLTRLYERLGRMGDAARLVERMAASRDPDLRFQGLRGRGHSAKERGDSAGAEAAYKAALDAAIRAGKRREEAWMLGALGAIYGDRGDEKAEVQYQERALKANEAAGDKRGQAINLSNLAQLATNRGDAEAAKKYHKRAIAAAKAAAEEWRDGDALRDMGYIIQRSGDHALASQYYERALALDEKNNDKAGQADDFYYLGWVAEIRGDKAAYIDFLKRSLAIYEELGDKASQAGRLIDLGNVTTERAVRKNYYERSLALQIAIDSKTGQAAALNNLGSVTSGTEACDYFRRALALYESAGAVNTWGRNTARNNVAMSCPRPAATAK